MYLLIITNVVFENESYIFILKWSHDHCLDKYNNEDNTSNDT